jgi:hypothetical protein
MRLLTRWTLLVAGLLLSATSSLAATVNSDPVVPGSYSIARPNKQATHPGRSGPLTEQEREMARVAWRYFQNNTQAETGLVNSVHGFPSTTLWDIASSIGAVVSAQEIGLIDRTDATARLRKMLETLARIELFRGLCPNKAYNSATGQRVTYSGEPGEIGCSALDVGRLLVWMRVIEQRYPELQPLTRAAVTHWNVGSMVRGGEMFGTALGPDGHVQFLQEGRLGYEEYGAKAFRLWGYDTRKAGAAEPYGLLSIYGVRLPYDARDPKTFGAHNYVVTESYVLDGIEFGWDEPGDTRSGPFEFSSGWIARAAERIYLAQQARFEKTGIMTARTEHQLAGAPYFVYDTVFSDGIPWATITDTGEVHPQFASVALKGALGLWALWRTPYTDRLFDYVRQAYDPERGFYEGLLEKDGARIEAFTANNNGIILETLLYKLRGAILKPEPLAPFLSTKAPTRRSAPANAAAQAAPVAPAVPARAALTNLPSLPPAEASPIVRGSVRATAVAPAPHAGRFGALTPQESALALAAWAYFKANTQADTGLVDAVERYPSSTLWDTAASMSGIVAAQQLGLIEDMEAQQRLSALFASLRKIPLFQSTCPNKAFNTRTLVPTDYGNVPREIGCSALDVGRALVWLRIVHRLYPAQRASVEDLVRYWNVGSLLREGSLFGTKLENGRVVYLQEGRLGYEEYAAKGFALWGHQAPAAFAPEPYALTTIDGVAIAHDKRDAITVGGSNHVVTETGMLDGIEFGWDRADDRTSDPLEFTDGWAAAQAWHVYLAQQKRAGRTGHLTARTEHQLDRTPNFVYDTVFADGVAWATISFDGEPVQGGSAVALKAAIGLWVLWPTPYTDQLFAAVSNAFDPKRGIYEGVLERGGRIDAITANNNGIILAALLYKVKGPILRLGS